MDYFELLKAKRGLPVSEAYTALLGKKLQSGDYPVTEITGELPFSFLSSGAPISEWTLYGNIVQNGTPTPETQIEPQGVGKLVSTDWTIPIVNGDQTVSINIGQVQTVRNIKKFVLTGTEDWNFSSSSGTFYLLSISPDYLRCENKILSICSHYSSSPQTTSAANVPEDNISFSYSTAQRLYCHDTSKTTVADFKAYLAEQYANGTPVTVWYVLAEPTTGIVNEPLMKIGDYADELRSTDAGVAIPTVKGVNTLTTVTTVTGSARIKGRIEEV